MEKVDNALVFAGGIDSPERRLWASVVLAALDDAIRDVRKWGEEYALKEFRGWTESRNGREVLTNAGITPTSRVTDGLVEFVRRGVPTARALVSSDSTQMTEVM